MGHRSLGLPEDDPGERYADLEAEAERRRYLKSINFMDFNKKSWASGENLNAFESGVREMGMVIAGSPMRVVSDIGSLASNYLGWSSQGGLGGVAARAIRGEENVWSGSLRKSCFRNRW